MTLGTEAVTAAAAQASVQDVAYRDARALIAWMGRDEAIRYLQGGRMPSAGEDLTAATTPYEECRTALTALPAREVVSPVIDRGTGELRAQEARADLQAAFGAMNWSIAVVDLRRVLSFQKLVVTDGLDERVTATLTPAELSELCLPVAGAALPRSGFTDRDGKGITLTSLNPNLRTAEVQMGPANVAPGPGMPTQTMLAVTVLVSMGASYVQVAGYRGRYFVRDGNHRVAGLIRRGIFEIPCVLIEARSFEELIGNSDTFTYEVIYGDQPPFVTDFWNERVSRPVSQAAIRKVVRVRAEEFAVPR